jgi:hypothetical protein
MMVDDAFDPAGSRKIWRLYYASGSLPYANATFIDLLEI